LVAVAKQKFAKYIDVVIFLRSEGFVQFVQFSFYNIQYYVKCTEYFMYVKYNYSPLNIKFLK